MPYYFYAYHIKYYSLRKVRDVKVSNWNEIISAEAFFSSYAYSFESQIFPSKYIRVRHIFLDFKVSRYIEGYSFWSIWGP